MHRLMNLLYAFVVFLLSSSVFYFCEYLIYSIYLKQCSWPELTRRSINGAVEKISSDQVLRVALITDVHLQGPLESYWIDKVRRDWQLTQSYRSLMELHKPEIVFILGDIFDEGHRVNSGKVFDNFVNRFYHIFYSTNETQVYPLVGNHDIGYHNQTNSFLWYRFSESLRVPLVKVVRRKNVNFVLVNSVAMEQDGCGLCNEAERLVSYIGSKFRCTKKMSNEHRYFGVNNRPVLLQHYPLYRESDEICHEPDEAPFNEKYYLFKEKYDCLSKNATEFLLNELNPRIVFDGHTHHGCHTLHKEDIHEYTISSFNLRNKPNSRFVMAAFTEDDYKISKCSLPHDYLIHGIYVLYVGIVTIILYRWRIRRQKKAVYIKLL